MHWLLHREVTRHLPKKLQIPASLFEKAVACIKEFEGWHSAKHNPYIRYGHKFLPEEKLTANITEIQADSLLKVDLLKKCHTLRHFGKDALLLAVLAYNIGEYRLLGYGKIPKNTLIRKLEAGIGTSIRSIFLIGNTKARSYRV